MSKKIVSFSGGKDSTAMLLMLLEKGYPVDEVRFFDTGWEFPQIMEHISKVEKYTGVTVTKVHPREPFDYWLLERPVIRLRGEDKGKLVRTGAGWPSFARRWCTREKVNALYRNISHDTEWYVGIAADEAHRAEKVSIGKRFGSRSFPLMEWGVTEAQALEYCYSKGFDFGGLYNFFPRVSCYCCPLQRIGALRTLRKNFPDLWQIMLEKDNKITPNIGFWCNYTVHALEERFSQEDAIK